VGIKIRFSQKANFFLFFVLLFIFYLAKNLRRGASFFEKNFFFFFAKILHFMLQFLRKYFAPLGRQRPVAAPPRG
jgi:hypothetical protein